MAELENNIRLLKFPDNVRLRSGMYIGSTANPNVILREIIDNSIDELMLPNATDTVKIQVSEDGWCIVGDNGRGIPNVIDEETGISKLELAMANLHAGGKFDSGKAMSIGMNGVGSAATNALSEHFEVWSSGRHIVWNRGIKVQEDSHWDLPAGFEDMKTVTRFLPDSEIFTETIVPEIPLESIKYTKLICREIGKPNVHFIVNGVEDESSLELPQFRVKYGSVFVDTDGNRFPYDLVVYFDWEIGRTYPVFDGTVNGVHTPEGYHINWNLNQLKARVCNKLGIKNMDLIKLGLNMFVCVMASEVSFDSQTKVRLSDIKGFNSDDVLPDFLRQIDKIMAENKELFEKIKVSTDIYTNSVKQAQEIREINGLLQGTLNLKGNKADRIKSKLSATSVKDCNTTNRKEAELYIVEGKSAGGNLVKARDTRIHSILPLRGKPLSAFKTDFRELLKNNEWMNFVLTIGGGIDRVANLDNVRYGKIIIAADADPDGLSIAISILGTMAAHMRFLIDAGLVYVLETPLYLDTRTNTYYYTGEESKVDFGSGKIRRFKGLGEFNAQQFKDFAFNVNKRRLVQVTSENIEEALDLIRNTGPKKSLMISEGYLSEGSVTEADFDNIKFENML